MIRIFLPIVLLISSNIALSALYDRGGGFIYDSNQDITWYQNANLGGVINSPSTAFNWADDLIIYDSIRDVYWEDWRLPKDDLSCHDWLNCSGSEMGHLYYVDDVSYSNPGPFFNLQSGFYWFGTPVGLGARSFEFLSGGTALDVSYNDPAYAWAVRDGDVVPIPAAFQLFISAIALLFVMRRKRLTITSKFAPLRCAGRT
jgi:hypothetical protein